MVIHNFNVIRLVAGPLEANSPLLVDSNAMLPLAVATKTFQSIRGWNSQIIQSLSWLGIPPDEGPVQGGKHGPYRQTERRDLYTKYAWELVEKGAAFPCFCTPERLEKVRQEQLARKENPRYDGTCRNLDHSEARRRILAGEKYVHRVLSS